MLSVRAAPLRRDGRDETVRETDKMEAIVAAMFLTILTGATLVRPALIEARPRRR